MKSSHAHTRNFQKRIKLSFICQRYFDHWIGVDTWPSGHPCDNARFFLFVRSVLRYARCRPIGPDIAALITSRCKGKYDHSYLSRLAEHYEGLYETMCSYEETRKCFPAHLIERRNILACYTEVRVHHHGRPQQIDSIMKSDWGSDWKDQLETYKNRLARR